MTSLAPEFAANQRYTILQALAATHDGRLNETLIARELDLYGHRLTQDEVRDLLRWLDARSAIALSFAGDVIMIAEITRRGQDHVDRRGAPIEDIALPGRK